MGVDRTIILIILMNNFAPKVLSLKPFSLFPSDEIRKI